MFKKLILLLALATSAAAFAKDNANYDHNVRIALKTEEWHDWIEVDVSINNQYAFTHRATPPGTGYYTIPITQANLIRDTKITIMKFRFKSTGADEPWEFPLSQVPTCSIDSHGGLTYIDNPSTTTMYIDWQGCYDTIVYANTRDYQAP